MCLQLGLILVLLASLSCVLSAAISDDFESKNFTKLSYDEYLQAQAKSKTWGQEKHVITIPGTRIQCAFSSPKNADGFCHLLFPADEKILLNKSLMDKFNRDKMEFVRIVMMNTSEAQISEDLFSGLKNLKNLLLRNAPIRRTYFNDLENLVFLRIEVGDFKDDFQTMFTNLNKLEKLVITDRSNVPKTIRGDFFKNLAKIQHFSIIDSDVEDIEFTYPLPNLIHSSFYGSKLSKLDGLCNNAPKLTNLRLENNRFKIIKWEDLKGCKLEDLSIQGNEIENLDAAIIAENLPHLKELSLSTLKKEEAVHALKKTLEDILKHEVFVAVE